MGNASSIPIQDLPDGPWTEEFKKYPENVYKFEMLDSEKKKYECKVQRMNNHYWNGYVSVPPTHRLKGTIYLNVKGINVHGGLTYSDVEGTFGFDTYHVMSGDTSPADAYFHQQYQLPQLANPAIKPKYWTFEEVKKETERLALQLMKLH